jgi:hypothetical protein
MKPTAIRTRIGMTRARTESKVGPTERRHDSTLEEELVAFPNGAHDDLVDALVYAADLGAPTVPALPLLIGGKLIYSFNRSEMQRDRGRSVPIAPINRIRRG